MPTNNYSVIFLNTTHEQGRFIPADATLGLSSLQYWLAVDGITDTAVFPEGDNCDVTNIEASLEAFLHDNKAKIYAISCWSNSFVYAELFSRLIRRIHPGALIIGGGAHFHSRDNIKNALHSGLFDLVFRGGADPFFEFCRSFLSDKKLKINKINAGLTFEGAIPNKGAFSLHDDSIAASPHGIFSRAVLPVMHIAEDHAEITALFSDECGNNCDYCTVFKNKSDALSRKAAEDLVIDAYGQLNEVYDGDYLISIMDSSPFLGTNRRETFSTIERLAGLNSRISFSVLADPDDLDDEFIAFMKKYPVKIFFIGRDRINEDPFIGRRLNGRLRNQQQLDNEQKMVERFITEMRGLGKELYIGYIASPFDGADDAAALCDELAGYIELAGNEIIVQPNIFILNPYGGTGVERKSRNIVWNIADFHYPYPNVWHGKDCNMLWLELLRFVISPVFSTGKAAEMGLELLRFAAHLVFGLDKPDTGNRIVQEFMIAVEAMKLGAEDSITAWHDNLVNLYKWGLALTAVANDPALIERYSMKQLCEYSISQSILTELLLKDFRMIESKPLHGTWYDRYMTFNVNK